MTGQLATAEPNLCFSDTDEFPVMLWSLRAAFARKVFASAWPEGANEEDAASATRGGDEADLLHLAPDLEMEFEAAVALGGTLIREVEEGGYTDIDLGPDQ